jgi:hypothetical protein
MITQALPSITLHGLDRLGGDTKEYRAACPIAASSLRLVVVGSGTLDAEGCAIQSKSVGQ